MELLAAKAQLGAPHLDSAMAALSALLRRICVPVLHLGLVARKRDGGVNIRETVAGGRGMSCLVTRGTRERYA